MERVFYLAVTGALLAAGALAQAQNASKDDAVALTRKAVAHLKKDGVEAACKDFADPQGGFMQGELYVFVQDMQSKMVCHAANKRINGKDLSELKDADGKLFSKAMTELVKARGAGWVDYRWINPNTKAIESKTSYVERVNDTLWLGVGIYRQ